MSQASDTKEGLIFFGVVALVVVWAWLAKRGA